MKEKDVERLSLDKLVDIEQQILIEEKIIERAYGSSVYKKRWAHAGIKAEDIKSISDLQVLPFTKSADIIRAQTKNPIEDFLCSPCLTWFSSAGTDGTPKWIPYGKDNIRMLFRLLARLTRILGIKEKDRVLAVEDSSPRIGNGLPYFWAMMDMEETRLQLEFLVGAMSILSHINWVEFSLLRSPNILWARPQDAYTLIKHFEKAGNKPHSKPKEFLHHLRAGVLFGEPSAPVKQALIDAYGFESFDCYATTEFPCLFVECSAHAGLHVWMDICISEIIPSHELDKEQTDPLYKPKAIFLSNAEPGIKGEYVVTTFSQAFPLVRYRTEDLVRVVSTKKCQCGLTHPRIEVLGKINKE